MKKLEVLAVPCVMVDEYVPEVCKSLESRRKHIAKFATHSKLLKPIVGMLDSVELRVASDTENRKWFYAVDTEEYDLLYLMHLNPLKISFSKNISSIPDSLKRMAMYQGSVWRAEGNVTKLGELVPKSLFWKLFKGNQNWFSDSLQSKDGKRFWERRIREALDSSYLVFAVHFREPKGIEIDKLVPLNYGDDLQKYWTYEAKKDESGMYWRFAIVHP